MGGALRFRTHKECTFEFDGMGVPCQGAQCAVERVDRILYEYCRAARTTINSPDLQSHLKIKDECVSSSREPTSDRVNKRCGGSYRDSRGSESKRIIGH